ncbi:aldolase/citrate lyase family protein [Clostridium sp.]|uniref:HpcH/HpaI aldolase family protein n=1 Tax=Clostridium sp. TaxID=1506 RepID=UPI00291239A7|nr:aldolase/citrate lyase family protein [Clostridium sp.]MDU5105917.1 aldolase/citrate lyase family protein [Clostridium sp.]
MELKDTMAQRKIKGVLVKVINHPAMVIMAQDCGMDFIFYDGEHGIISEEKLHDLIVLGNAGGFSSIVRVPQLARRDVSRMLDSGAAGIMVPMIETKEQAEQLVAWSKYPPIGKRSYSGGANTHYGPSGNRGKNMEDMNHRTISIVQIETLKGVENVDEILAVDGIDAALIGPCDLGISIGNPDNDMNKEELKLIKKVADSCRRHNKAFGIIGGMELQKYFKEDINILVSAIDTKMLRTALTKAVEEYDSLE